MLYYKKVVYPVKIFYEESSIVTCETIKVFKITSAKIIGLSLWEAKGSGSKNKKYIHHPTEGNNQVMLKRSVGNSSDSKVKIPTPTLLA